MGNENIDDVVNGSVDDSTEKLFNLSSKTIAYMTSQGIENCNAYDSGYNAIKNIQQDPEYISFNLYLTAEIANTTLASNSVINTNTVSVASATGITTGKSLTITQGYRIFQSLITGVNGTTITLATPLDYAYITGANVSVGNWNLNQNGSSTPVVFKLQAPPNVKFHVTAISITITDDGAMDDSKFGSLTALTNGIVARRSDGTINNLFLITNNRGFYQYGYDYQYNDRASGTGAYGFLARKKIRDVNGNVISVDGANNEQMQLIVRDNLTTLTEFTVQAHGHIVNF